MKKYITENVIIIASLVGLSFLIIHPVSDTKIKAGIVILGLIISLYLEKRLFKYKRAFYSFNIFVILFSLVFLFYEKPVTLTNVKKANLSYLESFEDAPYVWGGENSLGIDCSGLMRRSMILGLVKTGIKEINPAYLKMAIRMWAGDFSAHAMKEEYKGYTKRLFIADSINKMDHAKIKPGDMAVTYNGIHIMAYLGNRTWIQADPSQLRVIKTEIPSEIPWYDRRVVLIRWNLMKIP